MPSSRKATTRIWGSWIDRHGVMLGGCLLAAAGLAIPRAPAQVTEAPQPDQVAAFMRAKLDHAGDVLEGLSLEDFDLIAKGAQELALASQASSWQVLQTADYARHSAEFRRACDSLGAAAKAQNLDGALVAWMEVTLKCVQCHRYVRDVEPDGR